MMEDSVDFKNKKIIGKLYDEQSLEMMRNADGSTGRGINRVQGIKSFALKSQFKKIGIAHCIAFSKEAESVKNYLSKEFQVFSVDCKCGRISKQEMFGGDGKGIMCNPAGQADYLKENSTELNISMGLCIGHDVIFNRASTAPVSTLIVKDSITRHNPLESIKAIEDGYENS